MIFRVPPPLSSNAERLLAHERELVPESPELKARVLARARMASTLLAPPVRFGRVWPRVRLVPLAGVGVVVASVAFAAWLRTTTETRVASPRPIATAVVERAQAASRSLVSDHALQEELEAVTSSPAFSRAAPPQVPSSASSADPGALELVLLQRARLALTRGEYGAALAAIAEHRRRFPSGPLREEREALRIRALEGLGRSDEARRAGERFRERYPRSVLSPQLGEAGRSQ
jgi:hypothetical protein